MRVGIVKFPGTLCDQDVNKWAVSKKYQAVYLEHNKSFLRKDFDFVILPGGFSFGDYIRPGVMAKFSEVTKSIIAYADDGGQVLGICNGFQILCEIGLLPGQLLKNENGKFICKSVILKCEETNLKYNFPVAHKYGNYYIDEDGYKNLVRHQQIWLTYENNINGSLYRIAGIKNIFGNVRGLMPHPERAIKEWMGSEDGNKFYF